MKLFRYRIRWRAIDSAGAKRNIEKSFAGGDRLNDLWPFRLKAVVAALFVEVGGGTELIRAWVDDRGVDIFSCIAHMELAVKAYERGDEDRLAALRRIDGGVDFDFFKDIDVFV